jgi:hypothetical protein
MSNRMDTTRTACCINLFSFFFFGCKLTVVGMFFDESTVDLVTRNNPGQRWNSTITREMLLI